jgi:hypothetical protein
MPEAPGGAAGKGPLEPRNRTLTWWAILGSNQ